MVVSNIALEEKLCQFIKEYASDQYCLELLQFFGAYPHTRFSSLAIIHALSGGRLPTERALRQLVSKGVIRTCMDNNILLHSLTEDEPVRSLVLDLAKLDWHYWQLVLRQIYATIDG